MFILKDKLSIIEASASVLAFFRGCLFVLGSMLFFVHSSTAELFRFQASAPLKGFVSPFFNEYGEKIWECLGERVKYVSESKIKIEKMHITFYCPQRPNEADMVVSSDKALISIPHQRASGKTLLTVTNDAYTILGEDWIWEGKQSGKSFSKVFIGKNANVMFYD